MQHDSSCPSCRRRARQAYSLAYCNLLWLFNDASVLLIHQMKSRLQQPTQSCRLSMCSLKIMGSATLAGSQGYCYCATACVEYPRGLRSCDSNFARRSSVNTWRSCTVPRRCACYFSGTAHSGACWMAMPSLVQPSSGRTSRWRKSSESPGFFWLT